ncbi:hypothetical protein PRN20_13995 [Devosia sp. ZB163]|uniref:hypothetical protein n=1 Tax=Devosia sp. ZB163 TaxID=3025938 RepID=UPI002361A252|nr:hypothetical protein [Devosia sp. ZB163]MDC9824843.1 hypothetical protein [Devosia sp. ZB163]
MPENKNAKHALTYNSLYDFEKGYADALLRYFSNRDDAAAWSGIGVENLAPETLENIRRDCRSFVINTIESAVDENGSMEVGEGLYDYDLGRHLFLERMETGVGFGDLASVDDELRAQLIDAAGDLKPFDLEIDDDRLVRIVSSPLTYSKLTQLQQGFADALVEFESQNQEDLDWQEDDEEDEDEVSGEWDGVTVHHFSLEALKTIVEDCERFVSDIVGDERAKWDDLFAEISEHDLGWYLYLERQGAGVGLRDLLPEGDLLDRVLKSADELGELSVEVGDDGQIHIQRQRGWAATPTS